MAERQPTRISEAQDKWGESPWTVDFVPPQQPLAAEAELVIIGGGFTGLAAALHTCSEAPGASVIVLEAGELGSGASGRTGGQVLPGSAAGRLDGLDDVLSQYARFVETHNLKCELDLRGVWILGNSRHLPDTPFVWADVPPLGVTGHSTGGTVNPGKMVSELARAATERGAVIHELTPALAVEPHGVYVDVVTPRGVVRAQRVLIATNATALNLFGDDLARDGRPCLAIALATAPFTEKQLKTLGVSERKPFYTHDNTGPYLWGRVLPNGGLVLGGGVVGTDTSDEMCDLSAAHGPVHDLLNRQEKRLRKLHPLLRDVTFTHRWCGPLCYTPDYAPLFDYHPDVENGEKNVIVLGGFCGHGVAQSVVCAMWAADVFLGRRGLPEWGRVSGGKRRRVRG